jgi:hypothetical protein
MNAFLDSIEPDFSDYEEEGEISVEFPKLKVIGIDGRSVRVVIVASGPESVAISHVITSETMSFPIHDTKTCSRVGDVYMIGEDALVILLKPLLFDPSDMFDSFHKLIVLTSINDKTDGLHVISNDHSISIKSTTTPSHGISGMPAHLLTDSIVSGRSNCTVLVNVHTSMRVEVDGIVGLWNALCTEFINNDTTQLRIVNEYKKKYPVNRKFPLYS